MDYHLEFELVNLPLIHISYNLYMNRNDSFSWVGLELTVFPMVSKLLDASEDVVDLIEKSSKFRSFIKKLFHWYYCFKTIKLNQI